MRIGTVAKKAGVGVETVRFYERRHLIEQPDKPANGGYRTYSTEIVERIRSIRQAQSLGFSLNEIVDLLSLRSEPNSDCGAVRVRAESKLSEVNEKISRLTTIQTALEDLVNACPGTGVSVQNCSILDALQPQREAKDV